MRNQEHSSLDKKIMLDLISYKALTSYFVDFILQVDGPLQAGSGIALHKRATDEESLNGDGSECSLSLDETKQENEYDISNFCCKLLLYYHNEGKQMKVCIIIQ